jgi:hypothetical protein
VVLAGAAATAALASLLLVWAARRERGQQTAAGRPGESPESRLPRSAA